MHKHTKSMTTKQSCGGAIERVYRERSRHITTIPISAMSVLKGISPSALNNLGPKEKCPEELGVSLRQKSKAPEVRGSRASIFASIPKRLANVVADYQRSPDVSLRLLAIVFDRQHAGEGGMISATLCAP
ncbi:MAG: hypothetical protein LKM38_02780 [Pseudomonas veronii]|jgi:hypothetical protein|nr:hypothetical protein [Pseudomonas veronii]